MFSSSSSDSESGSDSKGSSNSGSSSDSEEKNGTSPSKRLQVNHDDDNHEEEDDDDNNSYEDHSKSHAERSSDSQDVPTSSRKGRPRKNSIGEFKEVHIILKKKFRWD